MTPGAYAVWGDGMKRDNSSVLSCALIVGGVVALCGVGVRIWCGSPYPGMMQMGVRALVPPVWLMSLLWTLWYFVLGAALGALLRCFGQSCIGAWRGAFFFLLMLFAGFLWYPLFFIRQNLLCSLLSLLVTLACALMCALQWQRVAAAAGILMYLHVAWLTYLLILQLICLFGV